jgi:hypothetical protein
MRLAGQVGDPEARDPKVFSFLAENAGVGLQAVGTIGSGNGAPPFIFAFVSAASAGRRRDGLEQPSSAQFDAMRTVEGAISRHLSDSANSAAISPGRSMSAWFYAGLCVFFVIHRDGETALVRLRCA